LGNVSGPNLTRKPLLKVRSSMRTLSASLLSHVFLFVFITFMIGITLWIPSVAPATMATASIHAPTMKNVHENLIVKSVIEAISLSSHFNDGSMTTCESTPSVMTNNKTLSVFGTMDLTNSTIRIDPFMILPGSKYTTLPSNSSYSINMLDSQGKILARYPFNPKISTNLPEDRHDTIGLLSEAVPYISCTKQIVISKDGRDLASRYVSAHTPQVKITFPNGDEILKDKFTVRWQANDADGDRLAYSLLYTTDDGNTWQTISKNIKESQITINPTELPGGTKALFRVIATDGVNTAIDDSDHVFTVPSRAAH
jgi:hypothetical protein